MKLKFMVPNKVKYTNYKGVTSWRDIVPMSLELRYSQWHSSDIDHEVWLVVAYDIEKQVDREFALEDILEVKAI